MAFVEIIHDGVSARQWYDHSFAFHEQVILDGKPISEVPVISGNPGDTSTSIWPTIQGQSVDCQQDEILLCLCSDLGHRAPGEG